MPDSKLMSYITSDFQSQSDLKVGQIEWKKIMEEKFQNVKKFLEKQKLNLKPKLVLNGKFFQIEV